MGQKTNTCTHLHLRIIPNSPKREVKKQEEKTKDSKIVISSRDTRCKLKAL